MLKEEEKAAYSQLTGRPVVQPGSPRNRHPVTKLTKLGVGMEHRQFQENVNQGIKFSKNEFLEHALNTILKLLL